MYKVRPGIVKLINGLMFQIPLYQRVLPAEEDFLRRSLGYEPALVHKKNILAEPPYMGQLMAESKSFPKGEYYADSFRCYYRKTIKLYNTMPKQPLSFYRNNKTTKNNTKAAIIQFITILCLLNSTLKIVPNNIQHIFPAE
jgi:hypothetical protein